ncbi:MAG TPA: S8 family serine peptidase [Terriglobales bacterium]|nr:S8 family serine peptidase [Terriglobales bacterium]
MGPLDLVRLTPLMSRSKGRRDVKVALIDGPIALGHPDLNRSRIQELPTNVHGSCSRLESMACMHGTFVAGMLVARRGTAAPAICPDCTLILRPIFPEHSSHNHSMPSATPAQLASAIHDSVRAGARVINLSAAITDSSAIGERHLQDALDYAAHRSVLVVAAAGNRGTVGGSVITGHPWVIPVVACDMQGRPTAESNLGSSIGRRGLAAPGENIVSLSGDGKTQSTSGTSAAAPFVTGTIALLQSEFTAAGAAQIMLALTHKDQHRRSIAPPLLDAWAAYEALSRN